MAKRNINPDRLPSNNKETPNPRRREVRQVANAKLKRSSRSGLAYEVRTIGNSLFADIILPAIKSAIADFFTSGVNMVIFGQEAPQSYRRVGGRRYRSYDRAYDRPYDPRATSRTGPYRERRESFRRNMREPVYEDVLFRNKDEAELVLGHMYNLIAEYGWAKIGDLYSLVGIPANLTHERWGWDNLDGCQAQYTADGWIIDFPEPEYLD